MAGLHCGAEAPLGDGFDGLFIESKAEGTDHVDVARVAICIDDYGEKHSSRVFSSSGLFGILGLDFANQNWSRNFASDPINASARAAIRSRSVAGSITRADAATAAASEAVCSWAA